MKGKRLKQRVAEIEEYLGLNDSPEIVYKPLNPTNKSPEYLKGYDAGYHARLRHTTRIRKDTA